MFVIVPILAVIIIGIVVLRKNTKKPPKPPKQKRIDWGILGVGVAVIPFVVFFVFIVASTVYSGGGSKNKWDQLSDQEKAWYEENGPTIQKYKEVIDDIKNGKLKLEN